MPFTHELVADIIEDRKTMTIKDLHDKYSAFAKECPTLWEKIIDPDADLSLLKTMVEALSNVDNEKSYKDATEKMGYLLFDKYVPKP